MRAELNSIDAGFAKMVPLTGNAYKVPYINAGATGQDALGGDGLVKLRTGAIPIIAVDGTDYVSPTGVATLTNKTIVVASNTITTAAHGTLAATELNAALAELADDDAFIATALADHLADATDAHDASAISSVPAGTLAATDVQAALNELDTEKAPLASPVFTGNPTAPTPSTTDNDTSVATTAFVGNAYQDGFGGGGFGFKNKIINGDMQIWQRGTSFAAVATSTYTADRWRYAKVGAMVHTVSQSALFPTVAEAGTYFGNSLQLQLTTPDTSIAAGDFAFIAQRIEGYNFRSLAQRSFILSFWVRATLTGTYCVSFVNSGGDRSYVAEYTINTTDTWEKKTIQVTASPSAGTWDYTNGVGLEVRFALAAGTTFQTTADSWQTGNFFATSNQVNGVNTGATNFYLTGVQVEVGTIATPFENRLYGTELALCQRYYETGVYSNTMGVSNTVIVASYFSWASFKVTKRSTPSITGTNDQGVFGTGSVQLNGISVGRTDVVANRINAGTFTADAEF
jgi:hypothetical protein